MTGFRFNVRYTIVALPYVCMLAGLALAMGWERGPLTLAVALLLFLGISAVSLQNHYFNPHYAKEDVRAAVAFWRSDSSQEPLLSSSPAGGIKDAIDRYLMDEERHQYVALGGNDAVNRLQAFFSTKNVPSAYIVLARDWRQRREKAIRNAFAVDRERAYPGTTVLRVRHP